MSIEQTQSWQRPAVTAEQLSTEEREKAGQLIGYVEELEGEQDATERRLTLERVLGLLQTGRYPDGTLNRLWKQVPDCEINDLAGNHSVGVA